MLREFAVEPTLISGWDRLQRLLSQFGIEQGRMISRYPSKWRREVISALPESCGDVERARIIEKLKSISKSHFLIRKSEWDRELSWFQNAVVENERLAFTGILADSEEATDVNAIRLQDLDEDNPPEWWALQTAVQVERNPAVMANAIRPVLEVARELLIFVDPNFHPNEQRFTAPFERFLDCLVTNSQQSVFPDSVELHVSDRFELNAYRREFERAIAPKLPSGLNLRVQRWPDHKIHNRYVLTDRAAVQFGVGLDHNTKRKAGIETDTVSLLCDSARKDLLLEYLGKGDILGRPPEQAFLV